MIEWSPNVISCCIRLARRRDAAYQQADMVTPKIKALAAARARVVELEQAIATELNHELAGLPAQFGFADVKSFAAAVLTATGGKRRPGRKVNAAKPVPRKRRKRAIITDATRAEVKELVKAGKSGTEIAKAVGISLASVQKIKSAAGLVKKRK